MGSEQLHCGTAIKTLSVARGLRSIAPGLRYVAIRCIRNLPFTALVLLNLVGSLFAVFLLLG